MYEAFSMKVTDTFKKDFAIPGIEIGRQNSLRKHFGNTIRSP